ncbi:uncharacterized protein LOC103314876 isoform X2 [Tribolium castaneum]|uniref:FAM193 C-terminal domain-containing protein n=1 Tax=Tribolium castaneum TaxID=7070 RepID=D6W6L2_TRICA|nr:PREDICTED: uncharacterized protein LOC103314876 isoform X2 [Tribolium castaneum]EFA10828.2 hypothetical protein TcasGA2_TC001604 [Tribolium castaneum]|eukprot:XP_015835135.1 PREDICTED: uncharacterized protein LOC103314876 isoform X2 [Tribolium castaneum]
MESFAFAIKAKIELWLKYLVGSGGLTMSVSGSLEYLMIKQTCRFFAYKFEMGSSQSPQDASDIYSFEFLKALYDRPRDNINRIIKASFGGENGDSEAVKANDENYTLIEKRVLLDFFKKVVDMKSQPAKQWTDLQHYLCFIYRYCMTTDPDPVQEALSPYFIADMRSIVCSLMEEDQIQLCLRLFSLVREYTVFAHKQHQKIASVEASIESLFYYYEAFLSATKNLCKIFPELEQLLINTYKLGWLDFNTSIFMYYFYETPYVQDMVRKFEMIKDNVSIKAAGIYTVLTELRKLWRSQMLGINSVIANKLGARFKGLDDKMMASHKRVLAKNFWIDRTAKEKAMQDVRLFDCQLFTLVGNKNLPMPDPTLDESGQCICEDCLIIKYKSLLENTQNKIASECMKVSCRFCRQQVDLEHFQQHVNGRAVAELDGNNCKNLSRIISDNIDIVKLGISGSRKNGAHQNDSLISKSLKRHENTNGEISKDPCPKLANEPPLFKHNIFEDEDEDIDVTELAFPGLEITKMSRKTFYNFLKHRFALPRNGKENKAETSPKVAEKAPVVQNAVKNTPPKPEETKGSEVVKNSKNTNKTNGNTFPCGHSCKLEEELKSEFKKAYQDQCDHHKESKKCDCTFCEVFGTTTSHVHKTNETRNRLRIRLNQRNESGSAKNKKTAPKASATKVESPAGPSKQNQSSEGTTPTNEETNSNPLMNDIHGLLNYIEGNTNVDKVALAEKKAAKKARQRHKKEEERLKLEEEERKRVEEEKRKAEERLRNEELARQLAEKAAKNSKKENKKKKQKNKGKDGSPELVEETIPAMVTIKRVVENDNALPTVTITLKGSTPDQDKLLYTLVNGHDGNNAQLEENKKIKKNKELVAKTVNLEVAANQKKKKNKNEKNNQPANAVVTKELRVTLAVDPPSDKKNKQTKKTENKKDKINNKNGDINIPMLKLPPGITITKVDGPMTDRNYKATNIESPPYSSNIPVSKSGVIVVDTEKLIKQSNVTTNGTTTASKKNRRKRNKKQQLQTAPQTAPSKPSMVTLKNPIFQNMQPRHEPEIMPDMSGGQCQQASIFKNENGMVTIRSSRLQQSLNSGAPMPSLLPDLKPVLGPEVPTSYMSSCNFPEFSRISPFNAQEILSGLPGIEITKVDKNATRSDLDSKKACHTAEVSIIPANNSDKFNFDKDDLHYDNVFTPKDILEDDMDADERELEAFKRFCQQSVPPKRKEKVAHLNVKDIVLKKKNEKITA